MNIKLQIRLRKVLLIVFIWICIGVWISLYDHLAFYSEFSKGPDDDYALGLSMAFNTMAGMIGGMLGGTFLVFYINEKYRDRSYGFTIIAVLVSFILIVSFITVVLGLIFIPMISGMPLSSAEGMQRFLAYLTNPLHFKNLMIWGLVVALTQLFLQVDNKFGSGILFNFIKGRYRKPRKEERIFMFVDIKSSTQIAEILGNQLYHEFLKDFFAHTTNAIIFNKGQIYQYVGDEVVISWPLENKDENSRCISCFFDMKGSIQKRSSYYLEKYGVVPEFKAGIHTGEVIAGEIGIIKRDITYSGDVLNTTARIQSQCNALKSLLLISNLVRNKIDLNPLFDVTSVGEIALRGKGTTVELFDVSLRIRT